MNPLLAGLLGIIQGLTEFFPVSSSGHLALFNLWFGLPSEDLTFEILVHLATLAAIVTYFRKDWWQLARGILGKGGDDLPSWIVPYLIVSMIPAAIAGIFASDKVLWMNRHPAAIGICLLFMASLLFLGLRAQPSKFNLRQLPWSIAIAMGLAQAVAILPGISRSGITILCGLFLGLEKTAAARFSFLMAVPVIGGAGLLTAIDLFEKSAQVSADQWTAYGIGFLSATLSGFFALAFLMRLLEGKRFFHFGWYCLAIGTIALFT